VIFVDDVLLFTIAKPSRVRVVFNIINQFCNDSSLKISLEKSKVVTSKGVTLRMRNKVVNISHINFSNNIVKYLGFNMVNRRITNELFVNLLEKIQIRLPAWKGRLLNRVGRVTLVNSNGKIREILSIWESIDDRRRREISRKIVKFIASNKIYNEKVQRTLKLSKPRIQSSI